MGLISRARRPASHQALNGAKLALAVVGLLIWAYGLRADDAVVRWLGIAFLASAFLLRFVRRRQPPES